MKRLFLIPFLALTLFVTGCATRLESGGAYAPTDVSGTPLHAPDYKFYVVDAAFRAAFAVTDAAFNFEKDNELLLWKINPNIKKELDKVRPVAVLAYNKYFAARSAYKVNPVPANLSQLENLLAEMQRLSAAATAVLPKAQ